MNSLMILETAVMLLQAALALGNDHQEARHAASTAAEINCRLAYARSEGGASAVKLLCGAEYLPVRTCYVFLGSKELARAQVGDPIVYKYEAGHFWLKAQEKGEWLPFDGIANHVHLFPDSREWPSRPDELALTVCAGVPAHPNPSDAGDPSLRARENARADLVIRHVRPIGGGPAGVRLVSFVIRGGRVVFVGSDPETSRFALPNTQVLEGGSCYIAPGFHDAHTHLIWSALDAVEAPLSTVHNKAELVRRLSLRLKKTPATQWVIGSGLNPSFDSNDFTSGILDSVSSTRPVIVSFGDGHRVAINGAARRLLEADPEAKAPRSSSFSNILTEQAAFRAMEMARRSVAVDKKALFLSRLRYAAGLGITSIHEFGSLEDLRVLQEMDRENLLPIRITYSLPADTEISEIETLRQDLVRSGGNLRLGPVKLFLDGSLSARTAALSQPYSDDESNSGSLRYSDEDLVRILRSFIEQDIPVSMHAIGDAAVHQALVALQAFDSGKVARLGITIEHAELVAGADLRLMKASGATISMQPAQWLDDERILGKRIGATRLEWAFRWREISNLGVPLVFGSDYPFGRLSPWTAVDLLTSKQDPAEAARRMPIERVLEAYGMEFPLGSWPTAALLKPADLLILDLDFTATRRHRKPRILAVLVNGRPATVPQHATCK